MEEHLKIPNFFFTINCKLDHALGINPLLLETRTLFSSGVAGGEASGGTRPGAQTLGAQQHTFCNHFKRVFK